MSRKTGVLLFYNKRTYLFVAWWYLINIDDFTCILVISSVDKCVLDRFYPLLKPSENYWWFLVVHLSWNGNKKYGMAWLQDVDGRSCTQDHFIVNCIHQKSVKCLKFLFHQNHTVPIHTHLSKSTSISKNQIERCLLSF